MVWRSCANSQSVATVMMVGAKVNKLKFDWWRKLIVILFSTISSDMSIAWNFKVLFLMRISLLLFNLIFENGWDSRYIIIIFDLLLLLLLDFNYPFLAIIFSVYLMTLCSSSIFPLVRATASFVINNVPSRLPLSQILKRTGERSSTLFLSPCHSMNCSVFAEFYH